MKIVSALGSKITVSDNSSWEVHGRIYLSNQVVFFLDINLKIFVFHHKAIMIEN